MKAKEFREAIKDVSDETEVIVVTDGNANECHVSKGILNKDTGSVYTTTHGHPEGFEPTEVIAVVVD